MPLDSKFLLEVKEHVSVKLKSLGAFIDEELPDYIMVMVANKKSESSMAKDLQLFLGEHTVEFTKWLHATLDKLRNQGKSKPKDNEHDSGSSKQKDSRRKSSRLEDPDVLELHVDRRTRLRSSSRSRSPIAKKSVDTRSSREPHYNEAFSHSVQDEYGNAAISSSVNIKEERKVISTASLVSKSEPEEDAVIDSTQEAPAIRSIVKVRESEIKRQPKVNRALTEKLQPPGRLLKQAMNEVKTNIRPDVAHSKRSAAEYPIACSDVSSSGVTSGRTKFFVTLSGADCTQSTSPEALEDIPDISSRNSRDSRVSRSSNVKARLGDRRVLPYSHPTKPSAKSRLGPLISSFNSRSTRPKLSDRLDDVEDVVELAEADLDDFDNLMPEVDISDEPYSSPPTDSRTVGLDKIRLADRLNQKQLVVTLNDADDDDDLAPSVTERVGTKKKGQAAIGARATGETEEQANIPSSLERCKYWPSCRNGDRCQYIHPTEPCSTFPRCRLGDNCIYIHPSCRYDAACTREDCPFAHTSKRFVKPIAPAVQSVAPGQVVCRFQDHCTNLFCPFYHPTAPRLITLRPMITHNSLVVRPTNTAAVPCRFGAHCTNSSCPFTHPATPRTDKLKWVAPSKQQQQQQQQLPAPQRQQGTKSSTITAVSAPSAASQVAMK